MLLPDQTWIPPTDFGSIKTDTFEKERSLLFRYSKMMYHSTLVYSMVDISFRTEDQLGTICFVLILAAIINAIIFGQFAVMTEVLNRD